jgi:hypothetical protein
MGVLSEDTFDNEGARDYLKMWTAKLVATITEVVHDPERLDADEDGETLLMPGVELLALLCERYGEPPPKPEAVRCWRDKYLDRFDATADRLGRPAEFKPARRKAIEKTFLWLEGLAESHWS